MHNGNAVFTRLGSCTIQWRYLYFQYVAIHVDSNTYTHMPDNATKAGEKANHKINVNKSKLTKTNFTKIPDGYAF